jgi:hypothetical protein
MTFKILFLAALTLHGCFFNILPEVFVAGGITVLFGLDILAKNK